MGVDQIVDEFVFRLKAKGILFQRIESAPWIAEFEANLPRRLPRSFLSLVARYRFPKFVFADIEFFANLGHGSQEELVVAARQDEHIWKSTLAQRFVQIGRPAGGSYDVICFDMRNPHSGREWP